MTKTIPCAKCGELFKSTRSSQKRCPTCQNAHYNGYQSEYHRKYREDIRNKAKIAERKARKEANQPISRLNPGRITVSEFQRLNVDNSRHLEQMNEVARGERRMARV